MTGRTLIHALLALLLLLAGPVGASHSEMPAPETHCEDMEPGMQSDSSHLDHSPAPAEDCDSQCGCCPGTCASGALMLTATVLPPTHTRTPRLDPLSADAPYRLPAQPHRPPISA